MEKTVHFFFLQRNKKSILKGGRFRLKQIVSSWTNQYTNSVGLPRADHTHCVYVGLSVIRGESCGVCTNTMLFLLRSELLMTTEAENSELYKLCDTEHFLSVSRYGVFFLDILVYFLPPGSFHITGNIISPFAIQAGISIKSNTAR